MIEVVARRAYEHRSRTPLLFVHGAWHAAWCWENMLDYFSGRGWDSYALSLRHHGGSHSPGSLRWVRGRHYLDDIAGVMAGLDRPPVVIGHSMGGYLVQRLMEDHEVAGAVLMASVPVSGTLAASARFARRHPLKFLKLLATMRLWPVVETPELARELLFGPDPPDGEVDSLHEKLQDESFFTYLDMMALALPNPGETGAPVFVCAAADDQLFTVKEQQRTAEAYGVEAAVFAGFPHDMMLHRDWEELARAIGRWLEKIGLAARLQ